nr:Uncharacterised protein [Raoultella sp. NCTC 9187]
MQHVAAADGVAGDHRDDRFRTGADLTLEIEHVQVMHAGIVLIAAVVAAHLLVTAGAERQVPFAGQDNDANIVVIAGIRQRLNHLFYGQRTECITHLWAVNGDFSNTVRRFLVTNIGIAFGTIVPFNGGVEHGFIKRDHRMSFS